jgi:hypothetical protein
MLLRFPTKTPLTVSWMTKLFCFGSRRSLHAVELHVSTWGPNMRHMTETLQDAVHLAGHHLSVSLYSSRNEHRTVAEMSLPVACGECAFRLPLRLPHFHEMPS